MVTLNLLVLLAACLLTLAYCGWRYCREWGHWQRQAARVRRKRQRR